MRLKEKNKNKKKDLKEKEKEELNEDQPDKLIKGRGNPSIKFTLDIRTNKE